MIADKNTMAVLLELRRDARQSISDIARATELPRQMVFKKVKIIDQLYAKKYIAIVDFRKLGYSVRALFLFRAGGKRLVNFLKRSFNVNSVSSVSGQYTLIADALFRNIAEMSAFEEKTSGMCEKARCHFVVDSLKEEAA